MTDTPHPNPDDEREAIRDLLDGTDTYVLTWYGPEPMVALVRREKAPPTEHANVGEPVVLVEWHDCEDWALSLAEGRRVEWEVTEELHSIHGDREEAVDAARSLLRERHATT